MIQRRKPLARSTKPLKRTSLKRSTKPIAKLGRVGKRKQDARDQAKAFFFRTHGWFYVGDKTRTANCQYCGTPMKLRGSHAHHKKPRGEGGMDVFENFVIMHAACHLDKVHDRQMGRPTRLWAVARFQLVEQSTANAVNGLVMDLPLGAYR